MRTLALILLFSSLALAGEVTVSQTTEGDLLLTGGPDHDAVTVTGRPGAYVVTGRDGTAVVGAESHAPGRVIFDRVEDGILSLDPEEPPVSDPRDGLPAVLADGSTLLYDPETSGASVTTASGTAEYEAVRFVVVGAESHGHDEGHVHEDLIGVAVLEDETLLVLAAAAPPHGDDAAKMAEHHMGHGLIAWDVITHVAIRSGAWSDPETWGGAHPEDGSSVLVSPRATVSLASETARIDKLRILGALRIESGSLKVGTLFCDPGGRFEVAAADGTPVEVIFIDQGAPTDPLRLGHGAILHGTTVVTGEERTSHLRAVSGLDAGSTEIVLSGVPVNWRPGDRLLVPDVRPLTKTRREHDDEVVTIAAIRGARVTIDPPLAASHKPPRPDLPFFVAHLDRSVVFRSESTEIERRGHVMLMHNPNVTLSGAAFVDLGRTDAKRKITDPDGEGGGTDNPRGRYAVHFHRTGLDSVPPTVRGCVVERSPRWGFVVHDSHVVIEDSVAWGAVGAGFSAEIGNELGAFIRCMSVRSEGGIGNNDVGGSDQAFGNLGHGFWFQSPSMRIIDTVTAGAAAQGIMYNARPVREADRGSAPVMPTRLLTTEPWFVGTHAFQAGAETVPIQQIPTNEHRGNVVFASDAGLEIAWHHLGGALPPSDAVIDTYRGNVFWHVHEFAVRFRYSSGANFQNCIFYGDMADPIGDGAGIAHFLDPTRRTKLGSMGRAGVLNNEKPGNIRIEGCEISGFLVGLQNFRHDTIVRDSKFGNVVDIYSLFSPKTRGEVRRFIGERVEWGPMPAVEGIEQVHLWADYIAHRDDPIEQVTVRQDPERFWLNGVRAYLHRQASDFVPYPAGTVSEQFRTSFPGLVGATNAEVFARVGWIVGGDVAPAGAAEREGFRALTVEEDPPEVE